MKKLLSIMSITLVFCGDGGADQLHIQTCSFRNDISLYTPYWQNSAPACLCEGDCIDALFGYTIDPRHAMLFTSCVIVYNVSKSVSKMYLGATSIF